MTNFEMIAGLMDPWSSTPLYSILCGYWMTKGVVCRDCPLRYRCDREPGMSDEEMETWLKEEAKT